MIKMVAFDLDGTIGDTIPLCIEAFRQAVSPYAGHTLSDKEIVQTFGLNEMGMIKAVVNSQCEKALDDFYTIYEKMHDRCTAPYQGINDIIDMLKGKGIRVALITGKGEKACRITLEKFGMQDTFCEIATGLESRPNKAESIRNMLKKYDLKKEEFYYVGDALSDVTACQNAGVVCLSAAWSDAADAKGLEQMNAGHVFYTIDQLDHYFLQL
ncbi:MAG: HAD-IA family hydrolase [Coprococcus sp.]|nr:HAD-IA family hydrolase [Coprococcus sp.]